MLISSESDKRSAVFYPVITASSIWLYFPFRYFLWQEVKTQECMNMFSNLQENFANFYILNGKRRKKKQKNFFQKTRRAIGKLKGRTLLQWEPCPLLGISGCRAGLGMANSPGHHHRDGACRIPTLSPEPPEDAVLHSYLCYTSQNDRIAGDERGYRRSLSPTPC